MTLPVWPVSLPRNALLEGFDVSEPLIPPNKTEFEDGTIEQRQASRSKRTTMGVSFRLTPAQHLVFLQFYDADLGHGAKRFTAPVPPANSGPGVAAVDRTVQIASGSLKTVRSGKEWVVSMTLRVEDWF